MLRSLEDENEALRRTLRGVETELNLTRRQLGQRERACDSLLKTDIPLLTEAEHGAEVEADRLRAKLTAAERTVVDLRAELAALERLSCARASSLEQLSAELDQVIQS